MKQKIYELHIRLFELDLEDGRQETLNIQTLTQIAREGDTFQSYINELIAYLVERNNNINAERQIS